MRPDEMLRAAYRCSIAQQEPVHMDSISPPDQKEEGRPVK